jgi:hypothetical protein
MTDDDFRRLESKVDKLNDAVGKLVLIEERQANQGVRIGAVEAQLSVQDAMLQRVDRKVDQWVNRGVGIWAAVAVVFSLVQFWKK